MLTSSTVTGVVNSDQNAAQFDRTVHLTSPLAQDQVTEAYRRLLKAHRLERHLRRARPPGRGRAPPRCWPSTGSGDGFYWEIGVVVSPTTPTGSTPYSIEVFETPDGN